MGKVYVVSSGNTVPYEGAIADVNLGTHSISGMSEDGQSVTLNGSGLTGYDSGISMQDGSGYITGLDGLGVSITTSSSESLDMRFSSIDFFGKNQSKGSGRVTGLALPVGDDYAANKKYVDDRIKILAKTVSVGITTEAGASSEVTVTLSSNDPKISIDKIMGITMLCNRSNVNCQFDRIETTTSSNNLYLSKLIGTASRTSGSGAAIAATVYFNVTYFAG